MNYNFFGSNSRNKPLESKRTAVVHWRLTSERKAPRPLTLLTLADFTGAGSLAQLEAFGTGNRNRRGSTPASAGDKSLAVVFGGMFAGSQHRRMHAHTHTPSVKEVDPGAFQRRRWEGGEKQMLMLEEEAFLFFNLPIPFFAPPPNFSHSKTCTSRRHQKTAGHVTRTAAAVCLRSSTTSGPLARSLCSPRQNRWPPAASRPPHR